ncbi:hypothetical protein OSJ57_21715, partial [Sphingomonas sp. HH69]
LECRAVIPAGSFAHFYSCHAAILAAVRQKIHLSYCPILPGHLYIPVQIASGLHFCLTAGWNEKWDKSEAFDRLPVARAMKEADQWQTLSMRDFIGKFIEVWIIAQHAYWCVGRGLADARGRGKTLLRLRIVMDEGGWTLTPGTQARGAPVPTPDRLQTAISLLQECARLTESDSTF